MKQHSDLILTSDITSTFPGPLDNKMIVNSVADLTDAASWKIYNSRLQMQMSLWYPQMLVIVKSEDATAGVYQFSGTEEYELEDIGKWRKLAFADDIVAPPSADTIKGDWEPDVDGSGITNYPGANNAYRVTGNAAQALGIEIGDIVFINETNTGTTAVLKAANAVLNTDAIQEGEINKYYPPSDREKLDTIEVGAQKNVDPDWDHMQNKPFIPSDIVDLTDVAGRIPADVSQLSDAEGILTSELPNLSSVVGGTITEALNTLKTANTTVKGEWEPIFLGEEPIQNLFHQIVPDPIDGSGNPSVSLQEGGKSLLGISNSPGTDWTNALYFSPAQVSLKFKTTLNSSMGSNTAVSVGHFNSDENWVSNVVVGFNMYSDNKLAVMFVEYDEPNSVIVRTQATAKADVGVDSLDEIYVFILGDDLIVHVNDTEVARATFSNGAPTTTASVTQSKMLCASIGLDDTLEMLEIIPVAMNYPAQFANNAFTIVGNALSPIADDGDIVIGNKTGDGIAKVIGKSEGGGGISAAVSGKLRLYAWSFDETTATGQASHAPAHRDYVFFPSGGSIKYRKALIFSLDGQRKFLRTRLKWAVPNYSGSEIKLSLISTWGDGAQVIATITPSGIELRELGGATIFEAMPLTFEWSSEWSYITTDVIDIYIELDYVDLKVVMAYGSVEKTIVLPLQDPWFLDDAILELGSQGGSCHIILPNRLGIVGHPANFANNIFQLEGDGLSPDLLDGDLIIGADDGENIAFAARTLGEDVDLSDYYTKTEADSALSTKITKPAGFDEDEGDELKYVSGKGTLKDASALKKLGNMPDVVFSTENVTVGGYPIGYDALVALDKTKWGFGIVPDLNSTGIENSLMVLEVEDTLYRVGNTIVIPSEGGDQAAVKAAAERRNSGDHSNYVEASARGYNGQGGAGIYAVCRWNRTTKEEISREVYAIGETFTWYDDAHNTGSGSTSTMSRLVPGVPATPTSPGKRGQFAADADYLYYCYAEDSWATVPKSAFKTAFLADAASDGKAYARKDGAWVETADNTLPINWLTVYTSTFTIGAEHAGKSLWVVSDCVITVSAYSTLPFGFNCEIFKANSGLNVSVVTSVGDTIRDGKSVIESDASVFKSTTYGVIGIVGGVNGMDDAPSDGKTYARKDGTWVEANSDNLPEGTTNRYNKPREPIDLTESTAINSSANHSDLFIVPAAQAEPVVMILQNPSTTDYFSFTVLNESDEDVSFSDGTNPITDAYGFGNVTKDGLVTVLWTGSKWMISGGLD